MLASYCMGFLTLILSTNLENGNVQLSRCNVGLLARRSGFDPRQCNIFHFLTASGLALGPTQPPLSSGYQGIFLRG
jgi:hypothetical protein